MSCTVKGYVLQDSDFFHNLVNTFCHCTVFHTLENISSLLFVLVV